jgi:hypothetical protein
MRYDHVLQLVKFYHDREKRKEEKKIEIVVPEKWIPRFAGD